MPAESFKGFEKASDAEFDAALDQLTPTGEKQPTGFGARVQAAETKAERDQKLYEKALAEMPDDPLVQDMIDRTSQEDYRGASAGAAMEKILKAVKIGFPEGNAQRAAMEYLIGQLEKKYPASKPAVGETAELKEEFGKDELDDVFRGMTE